MGSSTDRCLVSNLYSICLWKYSTKCFVFFKYLGILILQTLWLFMKLLDSSKMMQSARLYTPLLFIIIVLSYFLIVIRLSISVYPGLAFAKTCLDNLLFCIFLIVPDQIHLPWRCILFLYAYLISFWRESQSLITINFLKSWNAKKIRNSWENCSLFLFFVIWDCVEIFLSIILILCCSLILSFPQFLKLSIIWLQLRCECRFFIRFFQRGLSSVFRGAEVLKNYAWISSSCFVLIFYLLYTMVIVYDNFLDSIVAFSNFLIIVWVIGLFTFALCTCLFIFFIDNFLLSWLGNYRAKLQCFCFHSLEKSASPLSFKTLAMTWILLLRILSVIRWAFSCWFIFNTTHD